MNTKIDAEIWSSLSRVQKRAIAENITVDETTTPRFDKGEIAAWASTLALSAAIIGFALIALR
jgi:hypothetical protein